MSVQSRTEPRWHRWRTMRHGIIAGITIFLCLVGGGVSYAAWTNSVTATSTASGATLRLSTRGFNSNAFTFKNQLLKTTGSVTLKNITDTPSTIAGTYSMTFGYTGDSALAAGLAVSIWSTTDPRGCAAVSTPPRGARNGHWDTVATTAAPITGSLAKNATASYCVRVSAAGSGDLASTGGALTIQPSVSASLKVGNWSHSISASTTQKTAFIFPSFEPTPNTWYNIKNQGTGKCLDVYRSGHAGTEIIDYTCRTERNNNRNQEWKFTRSSGNYYDVTPRHDQSLRLDVLGGSIRNRTAVNIQTDSSTRMSQEWQLQKRPGGFYQIVNRKSGMCLQIHNTNFYNPEIEYGQVVCSGTVKQRYTLVALHVDVPVVSLSCASAAGGGVTYTWSGPAIDTYNFQAKPASSGTWAGIGDAATGATSITVLPAAVTGADGTYTVRAQWLAHQLATSSLWKTTVGSTTTLACSPPATLQCTRAPGSNTIFTHLLYAFEPSAPQNFKLQIKRSATTWDDMAGDVYGTGQVDISRNKLLEVYDLTLGTYPVRAVTSGGETIGTSQLRVKKNSSAYRYLVCG